MKKGEPLEIYDERLAGDVLESMHDVAALSAGNALGDGKKVTVSGIYDIQLTDDYSESDSTNRFFMIQYKQKGYTIYQMGNKIYYRPTDEFKRIVKEIQDGIPGRNITSLTMQYSDPTEPLIPCNIKQRNDCLFIVDSIFGSLTGQSYNRLPVSVNDSVNENCKIRKNSKLSTDGDIKKSIKATEAKYKTKEEKRFDSEVEALQKKYEVVGCLDQQPEESVKIRKTSNNTVNETPEEEFKLVLPNKARYTAPEKVNEELYVTPETDVAENKWPKNRVKKSTIDGLPFDGDSYIWEPGDYVIFRHFEDDMWIEYTGQISDVIDDIENGQLITIICAGHTVSNVLPIDVRPDMRIKVQRNRFSNSFDEPRYASRDRMGINPETRLTDNVENDDVEKYVNDYKNFNNERNHVYGFVTHDGQPVILESIPFSLKDFADSKRMIRALNEDEELIEVPVEDIAVDSSEWPWAVIVSDNNDPVDENEPLRKIRVNPVSYVEANEESDGADGLVEIVLNGVETKMMKKFIKLIV